MNNSIISKSELAKMLEVGAPRISNLLNGGYIVENKDGKINLNHPLNKKYLKNRETNVVKHNPYKDIPKETLMASADEEILNTEDKAKVELALLNARLENQLKDNALLDIKIAALKKELVETEIMNKVIMSSFDFLFKELVEMPFNIVKEVVDIVKTGVDVENAVIELMTTAVNEKINEAIKGSEKAVNKFYGETG